MSQWNALDLPDEAKVKPRTFVNAAFNHCCLINSRGNLEVF